MPEQESTAVETPKESETPVVQTPVVETPEVLETVEGQAPKGPAETDKPPESTETEVKKYKIKVDGEEWEKTEEEILKLAQEGAHFGKKSQAVSDWEKSVQWKTQAFDQLAANPAIWKMAAAQAMGYDPSLVNVTPEPPAEAIKEYAPEVYYQQLAQYQIQTQQKQAIDNALTAYVQNAAQANNSALYAKAQIKHNLSVQEAERVASFLNTQMRPNQLGMYSDEQADYAVNALFGRERAAQEKLEIANNIQKTIKKATQASVGKTVSAKPEEITADVKDAKDFRSFLHETGMAKPLTT